VRTRVEVIIARMSTTLSMWLGIAFVVLAIAAVLLQAWLWNPKYWDHEHKKSHAPRFWMNVHRAVGYAYAALYVAMMFEMVPRLWEYQVELPARTVVHAAMAITIGVLLVVKILVLRFFRWFEEGMPLIGLGLLVCTIVLAAFSVPFALRAHGSDEAFSATNRRRVRTILERLDLPAHRNAERLSSEDSLRQGREVVVQRCAQCHDLRIVLAEPRTGSGWLNTCRRMQDKPTIDRPLSNDEVLFATAYLVAITPALQESVRQQREVELAREEAADAVGEEPEPTPSAPAPIALDAGVPMADAGTMEPDAGRRRVPIRRRRRDAGVEPASEPEVVRPPAPIVEEQPAPPLFYNAGVARRLMNERCSTECHGLADIQDHGGDDMAGWSSIVARMVRRGAELDSNEARIVARYLSNTYPQ
jgi:hypothetical protein